FHYDPLLSIASITPSQAPASGSPPVQVTIDGTGFDLASLQVFIGALPASSVSATASVITATAPAGSPGPADVRVTAGGLEARKTGAFTFTAPLSLTQVAPSLGAQAGGTRVTLYGRGFGPSLSAAIGGATVASLSVVSPTQATGLTPPGTPGAKPVSLSRAGDAAQL